MEQSHSQEANRFSASQKNSPHFMEPQGSQVPTTYPYLEPAQSSPYPHIPLPENHLNIILPSMPGSPKSSLSLTFPHSNSV